jgi:hypothetical protein
MRLRTACTVRTPTESLPSPTRALPGGPEVEPDLE